MNPPRHGGPTQPFWDSQTEPSSFICFIATSSPVRMDLALKTFPVDDLVLFLEEKNANTQKGKNYGEFYHEVVVEPTHLKKMRVKVKLDHFPRNRDETKKYLSCHHLDKHSNKEITLLMTHDFVGFIQKCNYTVCNMKHLRLEKWKFCFLGTNFFLFDTCSLRSILKLGKYFPKSHQPFLSVPKMEESSPI